MTTAASITPFIGSAPASNWFTVDTTQRHPLGTSMTFVDPYYGQLEAIYLQMPASTALKVGHALVWNHQGLCAALANTANLGCPVGFAMNAVASSATAQYGWVVVAGTFPLYSGASVAAAALIGVTAAGQLGAIANGKEVLNCVVKLAATGTVAKTGCTTLNGSGIIKCSNTDGLFVGQALTGTGVGASALVSTIDPSGQFFTASVVSTATGTVTVTATNNDSTSYWNTCVFQRPFMQGQVT